MPTDYPLIARYRAAYKRLGPSFRRDVLYVMRELGIAHVDCAHALGYHGHTATVRALRTYQPDPERVTHVVNTVREVD
jgi:hypothetical protein